jgi:glyoxylase-like metal-dependent hydrolase (beta-lactamase superfamily II)
MPPPQDSPSPIDGAAALPDDLRLFVRNWLSSNNLLCLGDEPALIDTGHVKHAEQTVRLLADALDGGAALATIAHTHLHSDHCGGTAALQAACSGAQTWVPESALPHVQAWDQDALTFGDTSQRCTRFTAQRALTPGHSVRLGRRDWQIHAAPGHDALAVLLFESVSGVLMAGDALWEHGIGVIFPHIDGSDGFQPFIDTLALIERLRPAVIVPGHGAAFTRTGGAIDAALARARQRITWFAEHPAQHALYAAKVLIKYQMLDVEHMPRTAFHAWLDAAPILHLLHRQHRPDLAWNDWLGSVLAALFDKGTLRQTETEVLDGV